MTMQKPKRSRRQARALRRRYGDVLGAEEPGVFGYEILGIRPTPDGRDVNDSWDEILRWAQYEKKKSPDVRRAIRKRRKLFVLALNADGKSYERRELNPSVSRWLDEDKR